MKPTKIFAISCVVASTLFSATANSQSTEMQSVFITQAIAYVKVNELELSTIPDVKYEIFSENEKEVVVSVIGHDTSLEKIFIPELNEFEEHTIIASRGVYLHFCKKDQKIYKVKHMQ